MTTQHNTLFWLLHCKWKTKQKISKCIIIIIIIYASGAIRDQFSTKTESIPIGYTIQITTVLQWQNHQFTLVPKCKTFQICVIFTFLHHYYVTHAHSFTVTANSIKKLCFKIQILRQPRNHQSLKSTFGMLNSKKNLSVGLDFVLSFLVWLALICIRILLVYKSSLCCHMK